MNLKTPGEVDALSADRDYQTTVTRIRENLRARQRAPTYVGHLTEEEAEYLLNTFEEAIEERDSATVRAESAKSDLEEVQDELSALTNKYNALKESIAQLNKEANS